MRADTLILGTIHVIARDIDLEDFMKGLFKYSWILVALFSGVSFVACNKSSGGGGGGTAVVCPIGYGSPDGVNCVSTTGGIPAGTRIGFYAQTSNYPYYTGGGSAMNLGSGFRTLLKNAMGVCDREAAVGGTNCGLAACDAWLQGYHDMVLVMDGSTANQAKLVIRSYPYVNPYYNYTCSIPSASNFFANLLGFSAGNVSGVFDPLVLTTTVWPINKDQGFELRANGPTGSYAWWKLMQLQVTNGKIEDPTINFTLYIDGGNQQMLPAVTGTMVRCQTQSCGVTGL